MRSERACAVLLSRSPPALPMRCDGMPHSLRWNAYASCPVSQPPPAMATDAGLLRGRRSSVRAATAETTQARRDRTAPAWKQGQRRPRYARRDRTAPARKQASGDCRTRDVNPHRATPGSVSVQTQCCLTVRAPLRRNDRVPHTGRAWMACTPDALRWHGTGVTLCNALTRHGR